MPAVTDSKRQVVLFAIVGVLLCVMLFIYVPKFLGGGGGGSDTNARTTVTTIPLLTEPAAPSDTAPPVTVAPIAPVMPERNPFEPAL